MAWWNIDILQILDMKFVDVARAFSANSNGFSINGGAHVTMGSDQ